MSGRRSQEKAAPSAVRAAAGDDAGLHAAEPLLTPETVAGLLACSRKSIYAWAARGALPSVRLGRLVRFRPSDVRRFIEANSSA